MFQPTIIIFHTEEESYLKKRNIFSKVSFREEVEKKDFLRQMPRFLCQSKINLTIPTRHLEIVITENLFFRRSFRWIRSTIPEFITERNDHCNNWTKLVSWPELLSDVWSLISHLRLHRSWKPKANLEDYCSAYYGRERTRTWRIIHIIVEGHFQCDNRFFPPVNSNRIWTWLRYSPVRVISSRNNCMSHYLNGSTLVAKKITLTYCPSADFTRYKT